MHTANETVDREIQTLENLKIANLEEGTEIIESVARPLWQDHLVKPLNEGRNLRRRKFGKKRTTTRNH